MTRCGGKFGLGKGRRKSSTSSGSLCTVS
ncbi:hypothetical protein LINPERHAP1_LOCUS19835 [Linum perenne]